MNATIRGLAYSGFASLVRLPPDRKDEIIIIAGTPELCLKAFRKIHKKAPFNEAHCKKAIIVVENTSP